MLALSAAAVAGACSRERDDESRPADGPGDIARAPRKPGIVVYLSDTMRADALGVYNPGVPFSPFLDSFARESYVFERCFSQSTWTKPAMASLFTGVLSEVHQTVLMDLHDEPESRAQILRDSFTTLAEALQAAGYRTALFQSNAQATEELGFRQGFDHYSYLLGQPPEDQVRDALDWVETVGDAPFFVFIHQLDPHGPYTPKPETYESLFGRNPEAVYADLPESDRELLTRKNNIYIELTGRPDLTGLSQEGLLHLQRMYWGEVRQIDEAFEGLCLALEQRGLKDDCCIVFTSDHGESFGEFGEFCHGNFLYWPELHVPALVRPPKGCDGERVPSVVGLYDLYPTLLSIAGAPIPEAVSATPLLAPDGRLASNLPEFTWTHHMFQRQPPEQLLKIPRWRDAALARPVENKDDVDTWFTGVTDGVVHLVYNAHYGHHTAARMMGDKAFAHVDDMPAEYEQRLDTLHERLHGTLPELARKREQFGPPEYLGESAEAESISEAIRALGYM